jgi:O-antigen ligase
MNLGYETAIYLLIALIAVPTLLWRPHLLLYLLILNTQFPIFKNKMIALGPVNVYPKDLFFLLFIVSFTAVLINNRFRTRQFLNIHDAQKPLVVLVIGYICLHIVYLIMAILQGVPLDSSIRRFLQYSDCFYFFLPLFFLKDEKQFRNMLAFIVIVACLYPIWQLHDFTSTGRHYLTSSGTIRLAGSQAASILACGLFAILIWMRGPKQYVLAAIPILSIILIGHRSGFLALSIGLLLLFFWMKQIGKSFLFAYTTVIFALLSFIVLDAFLGYDFLSDAMQRGSDTFSTTNKTTLGRFCSIKNNFYVFLNKPLFGIGYDYDNLSKIFVDSLTIDANPNDIAIAKKNVLHPHNFFMKFLSHTGLAGTSLILLIIFSAFRYCHIYIFSKKHLRNAGIFVLCSLTFFIVMSLMNTIFFPQSNSCTLGKS